MRIVKYTVKLLNGDIIIKTFVNGKLKKTVKMSEEHKTRFKHDCVLFNMTLEEGVQFMQNKMNKIERLHIQCSKELQIRETHKHC